MKNLQNLTREEQLVILNDILEEEKDKLRELGYDFIYPVKITNITKNKSLGVNKIRYENGEMKNFIEISEQTLFLTEQAIRDTILHEAVHSIKGCRGHGKKFKKIGQQIKNKYKEYNISRTLDTNSERYTTREYKEYKKKNFDKYIIECTNPECENKIKRTRKSKVITQSEKYLCARCGSTLKRVK